MSKQTSKMEFEQDLLKFLGLEDEKNLVCLQLNCGVGDLPTIKMTKVITQTGEFETKRFRFVEETDDESNNRTSD